MTTESEPASWITLVLIASISAVVFQEVAEPWIAGAPWKSGRNGPVLSFLKSVHSINHCKSFGFQRLLNECPRNAATQSSRLLSSPRSNSILADWYKARFVSRSLIGCLALKFVGPVVFSICIGRSGSHLPTPEQLASFLAAFALVRSDSLEACELSGHMRYTSGCTVALNLMAALYKLRKFLSLVEKSAVLGLPTVLGVGTFALSACNFCMVVEEVVLSTVLRRIGAAHAATGAYMNERDPRYPSVSATITRHLAFLLILMLGHWGSSTYESTFLRHAYLGAQLVVLALLFSWYNEGLLTEGDGTNAAAGSGALEACTDSPTAAKRVGRSSRVGAWLGGTPVWTMGTMIAAATYSAGRVQATGVTQVSATVRHK